MRSCRISRNAFTNTIRTSTRNNTHDGKSRYTARNLSTKGGGGGKSANNTPPKMNFDHRKGTTILHEKAARAAELNAELNALLETQAKRRADEANRPFGSSFLDFVKTSKSQLINIFASFTCVMLAWQIVQIRKGARKLLDSAEEKNELMREYKDVLRVLSSDEFQGRVCRLHEREMKRRKRKISGEDGDETKASWFGRRSASTIDSETLSKEVLSDILKSELSKVIGDSALTDSELEDKKLAELQREMGIVKKAKEERAKRMVSFADSGNTSGSDSSSNANISGSKKDQSFGGLEQVLIEVQKDGDATVVKRSKGFI